jgi:spartin
MEDISRLLLSIANVVASQIHEGEISVLATGTLDVTLVSQPCLPTTLAEDTSSGNAPRGVPISSSAETDSGIEADLFLYLSIGECDFDLPLLAHTKVIPQGRAAYLIPSLDVPHTFNRLDLASSNSDDIDTFEIILSQFTAYEERPQDLTRQDLVLVDAEDGHVVASLPTESLIVNEDPNLSQSGHEKDPVLVDISTDPTTHKNTLFVRLAALPDGSNSSIVNAGNVISSGIIYSSNAISKGIDSSASWYINRRPTSDLPVSFQPATLERVRKIHHISNSAVTISAKATGLLASAAHSLGSGIRSKLSSSEKSGKRSSVLNKSLIAFETIADSIDASTKQLLSTSSNAATSVVRHKYGDQAADISHSLGSMVRNVGLVYVDARGVTRKAVIKGALKGMVYKAKVGNGNEVLLSEEVRK